MTLKEFSDAFDTLLNSYKETQVFSENYMGTSLVFDEYEKSLYLTKAQEEIVVEFYNGKSSGVSFEETEELKRYLNGLVIDRIIRGSESLTPLNNIFYGVSFTLPEDCLFIVKENLLIEGKNIEIIPATHNKFTKLLNNPFYGILSGRRAIRLDKGNGGSSSNVIKMYYKDSKIYNSRYEISYLKYPNPIVLEDFDEVSINGVSTQTECLLPNIIHKLILDRAVLLAIQSRKLTA